MDRLGCSGTVGVGFEFYFDGVLGEDGFRKVDVGEAGRCLKRRS